LLHTYFNINCHYALLGISRIQHFEDHLLCWALVIDEDQLHPTRIWTSWAIGRTPSFRRTLSFSAQDYCASTEVSTFMLQGAFTGWVRGKTLHLRLRDRWRVSSFVTRLMKTQLKHSCRRRNQLLKTQQRASFDLVLILLYQERFLSFGGTPSLFIPPPHATLQAIFFCKALWIPGVVRVMSPFHSFIFHLHLLSLSFFSLFFLSSLFSLYMTSTSYHFLHTSHLMVVFLHLGLGV